MNPELRSEFIGPEAGRVTLALSGDLNMRSMGALWAELDARLRPLQVNTLDVDVRKLNLSGSAGLALMRYLAIGGFTPSAKVTITGLSDGSSHLVKLLKTWPPRNRLEDLAPPASLLSEVADRARKFAQEMREDAAFIGRMTAELAMAAFTRRHLRLMEVKRVCVAAGADALPIISMLSFLIGSMIAFEAAPALAKFGAQILIADMVGYGAVRELGPMMTAIMLAGRSGAAFAAELGTMKVNEELAALSTMGLEPIRFLALQRIAAGILLTPLLTVYSMFMGLLGGAMVMLSLGFPIPAVYHQMATRVHLVDIGVGLGKSAVFGVIFSAVGCLRGFQTGEGPIAVGVSTTRAVVTSIFLIILADTIFAAISFVLN